MKVLVADDNPNSRQLVKDIIEMSGYEPVVAIDGPSALAAAQSQTPDLVILDVNMPGMSGFEVCTLLKSDEKLAQIPIIMLTAMADIDNRVAGLGLGADDYMAKPFSPRELAARINARLRAKAESDNLRATQEMIRLTFQRYVAPSVVENLLQDPSQVKLGGQLQEITVMFTDLEGFTSISERTDPEKLLGILNAYHALVVNIILSHGGTVDKFMGDGVMALYNTPLQQDDHPLRAVQTALRIRQELTEFYKQLEPAYRIRINCGIHTGLAIVGNVGTQEIMNFSAIGDTVNLASRLQSISTNGQILISQATYQQVERHVRADKIGPQVVKNRVEPVTVYEVVELLP